MGKVAVITATRDRGGTLDDPGYLFPCIASVYHQDLENHIHIIVDDGSMDHTKELVDRCAEKDPRIIYMGREKLPRERNTASVAQNYGIDIIMRMQQLDYSGQLADIEYITMLHSDDLLPSDSLSSRIRAMRKHNTSIVYGNRKLIDWSGTKVINDNKYSGKPDPTKLFKRISTLHACFPNHTLMWGINTLAGIGRFDEDIGSSEDSDMSLQTMDYARQQKLGIAYSDTDTYYTRYHDGTLTSSNRKKGLRKSDQRRIRQKHGIRLPSVIIDPKLLLRPHALLPEYIKNWLEPIRNNAVRRFAEDDPELIKMEKRAAKLWGSLDI